MSKSIDEQIEKLQVGDIVRNGYQSDDINLYLVTGSTSRKTGQFSTTKYWKLWHIDQDRLTLGHTAMQRKHDNKLSRVGHLDYKSVIAEIVMEKVDG